MPRTGHRLRDFLTAPILDPGIIDTFDSSDSLLPYRPEPEPDLIKVEPEITEISVEFGPGFVIEAEGPFDPPCTKTQPRVKISQLKKNLNLNLKRKPKRKQTRIGLTFHDKKPTGKTLK